jgi:hypothetical protein
MLQAPMIMENKTQGGVQPREGQWVGETKSYLVMGYMFFFFFFFFEVEVLINKKLKDPESPDPRTARP